MRFFKNKFKLRNINLRCLIAVTILCISLIVSTIQLVNQFMNYKNSSDLYSHVSKTALELQEGSDYLTDEVRFFVMTEDFSHLENYFYERDSNKRREKSIEALELLHSEPEIIEYLNKALQESHKLEETEMYSMKLVVVGKHFEDNPEFQLPEEIKNVQLKPEDKLLSDDYKTAKAWLLLFSEDYMLQKHLISSYKTKALNSIFDYTEKTHKDSYEHLKDLFVHMLVVIALVFFFNLILFVSIIKLVIRPLGGYIKNIKNGTRLGDSNTMEFNILTSTYNEMFDKNAANEILLRHKAEHDELTGLINRGAYNQILEMFSQEEKVLVLILIDVDLFKHINDTYGHPVGDKVLQRVASVLNENFRASDYVARIGGDEFAVLVTDLDSNIENVEKLVSSKMIQIKEKLEKETEELPSVTLSCGIGISMKGYNENLYEQADAALYQIKRSGRNGFTFYSEGMDIGSNNTRN